MNYLYIIPAIIIVIILIGMAGPAQLAGSCPGTSFSAISSITGDTLRISSNSASIAFNSIWNNGCFTLNQQNGVNTGGFNDWVFDNASTNAVINSGCGDTIRVIDADIATVSGYKQIGAQLQKDFVESSLPTCYSVYRNPGWSNGLSSYISGDIVFKRGAAITPQSCGNNMCESGETCTTCSIDCGQCPVTVTCGDHVCSSAAGETSATCPSDCPTTPQTTNIFETIVNWLLNGIAKIRLLFGV